MNVIDTLKYGTVPLWLYIGMLTVLTISNMALRYQLRKQNKRS